MADYQISASVTAQVQNFQQGMNAVVTSSNNAQRAVNNAGTAVRNNNQNYMNFGRVIQDLPYGINGIANNLTQLIPSAGALGLAFTALVTAVTFAQIGFGAWTRGINENKKALDNSKKASEEYLASLDQVTQAQLKGAQNAQKEVTELKTLYGITQDATLSSKQRKDAVDELQSQYPAYFKNIRDEAFLAGGATAAYDSLTSAIIATGKARAAQDLIVKNASRGFENEQKLADLEKSRLKQINAVTKAKQMQNAVDEQGTASLTAGGGSITAAKDLYDATKALQDTEKQISNIKTDNNILDKRNLDLTKAITAEVKKGADLAGGIGDLPNSGTRPKMQFNKLDGKASKPKDFIDPTFAYRQEVGMKATLDVLDKYQSGVEQFSQNLSASQERAIAASLDFNARFQESLDALASSSVAEGISSGFSSIGAAIVEGSNVFEAAGQALLGTISGFLGELGQMLVQKGIASIAAGVALNIILPGSGAKNIIGGAALIAAGAALSVGSGAIGSVGKGGKKGGNGSNVTAFATGAIVSGPTNALVGEYAGAKNNPEVIAPLNKLKSMLGNQEPFFQVIPIFDNKGLSIAVQRGNNQRGRV